MNVPEVINIDTLMDAVCDDRDVAVELMNLFFELTGQEKMRLNEAVAKKDAVTASAIAHKVAGSCASCGMSELATRFLELELLCKKTIPDDVNERLHKINYGLQSVRQKLEEHFNCSFVS